MSGWGAGDNDFEGSFNANGGGNFEGSFNANVGDDLQPQDGPSGECRICKKEGHFARECPDAGPMRCGNCRKQGHHIDECPDPLVCPRCQGEHKVRDCSEPMKCRHCEGEHMARDCPTYVATCKNCGQEGKST